MSSGGARAGRWLKGKKAVERERWTGGQLGSRQLADAREKWNDGQLGSWEECCRQRAKDNIQLLCVVFDQHGKALHFVAAMIVHGVEVFGDVLYHFLSFAGIICHVVVVALAHIGGKWS